MQQLWVSLAAIPSPSANSVGIGPLTLNAYGVCIALGVMAAVAFARPRWAARGGRADDVLDLTVWVVPAGLVGARIYHIINDWRPWHEWLEIWNGGLGIGGGLAGGAVAGYWFAKKRDINFRELIDAVVPAIPIGQAIGRFGNWFNQENFGKPTDLPWGLQIDPEHRPAGFIESETFHPAFLYEGIWNAALVVFLVRLDRRGVLKSGMILPVYVIGYGIGRLLIEAIRIDPAPEFLGLRFNLWIYGVAVILAVVWMLRFAGNAPSFFANRSATEAQEQADKV